MMEPVAASSAAREQITEAIVQEVRRACPAAYPGQLRAVVLTGSMARGEGTLAADGAGWTLLGDVEFLVVFRDGAGLPSSGEMRRLASRVEQQLRAGGITCAVDFSAVRGAYLRSLRPHIFAFELRAWGRAVWGDAGVLDLIPHFPAGRIPRQDAFRMLCNRMVEQLSATVAQPAADRLSPALAYATAKLYLDMACSLLVFAGEYAPSYRARSRNLEELARGGGEWPFALPRFAQMVARCTDWKLEGVAPAETAEWGFWEQAISYAHALWRWELARLTGADPGLSDEELWRRWMRRQPLAARGRGWLHVVRATGWWRGWRDWPRWAVQALRASPRLWIYGVAAEMFFRLPVLQAGAAEPRLAGWTGRLPAPGAGPWRAWRDAGEAVAANYKRFLVGTRS